MEFFNVIQTRHSVRAYRPDGIDTEKLNKILDCANQAPSAGNLQAYDIYIARDANTRTALAKAALNQDFIAQAPVVLVFCAHPERSAWRYHQRGIDLYCVQDATIACTYAMLAATALGLGSVWVGAFDTGTVRQVIGASRGILPIAILPIGYSSEPPSSRSRRKLADLVHEI